MSISLVLGGARSGKSRYAENLAKATTKPVVYIATAEIRDKAIQARVALHQAERPAHWRTVESPLQLADTLKQYAASGTTLLVDCLTMWVTNLLCTEQEVDIQAEIQAALQTMATLPGEIILVSNEVGMGIIPMGSLTRDYVDTAGRLHQDIAQIADRVVLVVAGLPMAFKGKV